MLPYKVPELLPEDTSINITTPLHPQATYLSILILSGLFGATNKWAQERHVKTHLLLQWDKGKGIGVSPEEKPGLGVSGGSVTGDREDREKSSQTNPSEGCLIVTEFPAGVTLKKTTHRKRAEMFGKHLADQYAGESWDSPSVCSGTQPEPFQAEYCYISITQTEGSTYSAYFCPQLNCTLFAAV